MDFSKAFDKVGHERLLRKISQYESTVRLFADDTIAYLTVDSLADPGRLQRDLDRLAHWESLWQMEFHPDNCQVL